MIMRQRTAIACIGRIVSTDALLGLVVFMMTYINNMQEYGEQKHIISNQAKVSVGDAVAVRRWSIKPRF